MTTFTFDDATDHASAINQAIGAASVCWEHPERAGLFLSDRAREIGIGLHARLAELPDDTEVRSISAAVTALRRTATLLDTLPDGVRRRQVLFGANLIVSSSVLVDEAHHLEGVARMLEEVRP